MLRSGCSDALERPPGCAAALARCAAQRRLRRACRPLADPPACRSCQSRWRRSTSQRRPCPVGRPTAAGIARRVRDARVCVRVRAC
eukprot:164973-Chlamydomonas_euryale.AAC.1